MAATAEIKHNTFPQLEGNVESLGFIPEGKEKSEFNVGITKPGHHVFGSHKRDEYISVIYGEITINGKKFTPADGERLFPSGGQIVFDVEFPSAYLCRFPND